MEKGALISPAKMIEDSRCGNKGSWVVELEELLKEVKTNGGSSPEVKTNGGSSPEVKTNGGSSPVVLTVANAFLTSEQEYYVPRFISVGPYHFERAELKSMEPHKNEALRRMQQRISGRSMQSIVETEIMAMDESISKFYDKELTYSAIDLAWMVTRDSCFLFEFMLNFVRTHMEKQEFHKDRVVEGRYDAVLNSSRMNPSWKNILYDLALFENQIPLSVLHCLLSIAYSQSEGERILDDILGEIASLSNMAFKCGMKQSHTEKKSLHFLEELYYSHVGWDLAHYTPDAHSDENQRFSLFSWTKSTFTPRYPWLMRDRGEGGEEHVRTSVLKLPSAADLKKKGVGFCAVTPTDNSQVVNTRGILWVWFEEKTSTLHLPEVRIGDLGHALLRNFIALEFSSHKYYPYPITTFAYLMNELIHSEEDVAVLREANIIKNFFGSNKEAAECFNAITRDMPVFEGCKPIDDARVALRTYLRRKDNFWKEYIRKTILAGSVGGLLLLVMTMVQVFCLFYRCNRST